jgi:2,3-bisphosphoglycerate-independent phosphoglycerate mutase
VSESVPFLIYNPLLSPDAVQTFDEQSVRQGSYGLLQDDTFIRTFLNN